MSQHPSQPLVQAVELKRLFRVGHKMPFASRQVVHAVDGVTIEIFPGETLGLVGESGSGKSTIGRLLLSAIPPSSGTILFDGEDITNPQPQRWLSLRRRMQLVQQNPGVALDPRMTIGSQLREVLTLHHMGTVRERYELTTDILGRVGLRSDFAQRFPHELSGGQQQRVAIARALLVKPQFLVCDEPVSALDPSVQAQVLNLLQDLQAELRLTMLFVSHDLNVIRYVSNRIAVLYLGRVAEIGPSADILKHSLHPYTRALLRSIPVPDPLAPPPTPQLAGEPPDPAFPPTGCRFHTRCPLATSICKAVEPVLTEVASRGHKVACHHAGADVNASGAAA